MLHGVCFRSFLLREVLKERNSDGPPVPGRGFYFIRHTTTVCSVWSDCQCLICIIRQFTVFAMVAFAFWQPETDPPKRSTAGYLAQAIHPKHAYELGRVREREREMTPPGAHPGRQILVSARVSFRRPGV